MNLPHPYIDNTTVLSDIKQVTTTSVRVWPHCPVCFIYCDPTTWPTESGQNGIAYTVDDVAFELPNDIRGYQIYKSVWTPFIVQTITLDTAARFRKDVSSALEITDGHRTFAVHLTKMTDQLPFC